MAILRKIVLWVAPMIWGALLYFGQVTTSDVRSNLAKNAAAIGIKNRPHWLTEHVLLVSSLFFVAFYVWLWWYEHRERPQGHHAEQVGLHGLTHAKVDALSNTFEHIVSQAVKGQDVLKLEAETTRLADEIEAWFNDEFRGFIGYGIGIAEYDDGRSFDKYIVSPYSAKFGKRVNEVRDKWAVSGFHDSELDARYRNPVDNGSIHSVINGLHALVKQSREKREPAVAAEQRKTYGLLCEYSRKLDAILANVTGLDVMNGVQVFGKASTDPRAVLTLAERSLAWWNTMKGGVFSRIHPHERDELSRQFRPDFWAQSLASPGAVGVQSSLVTLLYEVRSSLNKIIAGYQPDRAPDTALPSAPSTEARIPVTYPTGRAFVGAKMRSGFATVHRCSQCGFGILIPPQPPGTAPASLLMSVTCTKCGNTDQISTLL